ncbi:uncharacterized protein LOC106640003 [Copidosoma floridanum]|uniref:uncharacterized protein LOC106640003 n=1 Tax=Copidosoma floridanum TaxID=29053 RepID=UPI0006C96646|nr:uncharacterized protein LOC106640003 [Copidosoma floridanum]
MHAVGLHSALAIKRQRKRRDEQRRARERRYSSQSGESGLTSPKASSYSLDQNMHFQRKSNIYNRTTSGIVDSKVVTSIGMLHIGVVFFVSGIFLLLSGILPNELMSVEKKAVREWWNELIAIGLFLIIVGSFLILLNTIIAKREEDELEHYVQRQLTRSKSGHRLERDSETGGLTTRHANHMKITKSFYKPAELLTQNNVDILLHSKDSVTTCSDISDRNNGFSRQLNNKVLLEISEEDIENKLYNTSLIKYQNHASSLKIKKTLNLNNSYSSKLGCLVNETPNM